MDDIGDSLESFVVGAICADICNVEEGQSLPWRKFLDGWGRGDGI